MLRVPIVAVPMPVMATLRSESSSSLSAVIEVEPLILIPDRCSSRIWVPVITAGSPLPAAGA